MRFFAALLEINKGASIYAMPGFAVFLDFPGQLQ